MNDKLIELKEKLLLLDPSYDRKEGTSVGIRCPFCGDSIKSSMSAHLNILIDTTDTQYDFPVYNCFLCHAHGPVNKQLLEELGINDGSIMSTIKSISYKNRNNPVYKSYCNIDKEYNLMIPEPEKIKRNKIKLDYIRKRLGYNFNMNDIYKFKIILDIKQFLAYNGIKRITCKDYYFDILSKYYIGFLTTKNNYVILRRVDDFGDLSTFLRYYNYNIFGTPNSGSNKFYSISNTLDIMSPEKIHVVMSEGIFDIIGSYLHVYNKNDINKVFVAVNGSGYPNTFKHFIKRYKIIDNKLTIMGDRGMFKNQKKHKNLNDTVFYHNVKNNIINELYYKRLEVKQNYHLNEKDFGVSKDKIDIESFIV